MNISTLPCPWVSQLLAGATEFRNDCGAAASASLLRGYNPSNKKTPDELYREVNPSGEDRYLSLAGLSSVILRNGVPNQIKYGMNTSDLFTTLRRRQPVLALVNYGKIVRAGLTQFTNFIGSHFVVFVGMDTEYVVVNDPYRTDGQTAWPIALVDDAWSLLAEGNPSGSAIVPYSPIGAVVVTPGFPKQYEVVRSVNVRPAPSLGNNPIDFISIIGTRPSYVTVYESKLVQGNEWARLTPNGTAPAQERWCAIRYGNTIYLKEK